MALVTIPLDKGPNQSFLIMLPINKKNVKLLLDIGFKEVCNYWTMTIKNPQTKEVILSNIPLLNGGMDRKSANILRQFQHLNLGSAFVVKTTEVDIDSPDDSSLGTDFVLVWGDNYDILIGNAN